MKKFIIVIMALTLLITTSCAKKEDDGIPEGMTAVSTTLEDYTLYYPEGWSVDRSDGMVSVYVSDKDRSNVSVVAFNPSNNVTNVDDYLNMGDTSYFEHMKKTFPDLEMLSDGEETTLGGVPARQYVFTATVAGEPYKFRQVIAYRYEIYMLTYTSTLEGFDTHTDEVNKIISEFKFN